MNRPRIVLAYTGSAAASAAAAWLREHQDADVVTLTVDVGQSEDLEEVRARALACGALRAHVVDAREAFARDCVVPALRAESAVADWRALPAALVARTLVEIAAVESADAVAHAGADGSFVAALDEAMGHAGVSLPVFAPVRENGLAALLEYGRRRALPGAAVRREPHLLIRPAADPVRAPLAPAHLHIAFDDHGLPVALNGVPMALEELIESVSLIAGHYGLAFGAPNPAPGAQVLRAAYAASGGRTSARLSLSPAALTVDVPPSPNQPAAVGAGLES